MRTGVVDYGLGNLPSVIKALERAGAAPVLISSPGELRSGLDAIVLPGVGHFGAGSRNLRPFAPALREWAAAGRPLLGICLGLQLLFEKSDEDPSAEGLGICEGEVRRIEARRVPHMGWNTLDVSPSARVLSAVAPGEMVYFVHSYVVRPDPSVAASSTTYESAFCSGLEQGSVVGVQFHPEKSGEVGRRLLERFCREAA
ncbi:MAG TPA: imidazole glycerol phosphate synthase subunit HisH [Actinomycetota bacterium]|nr:imidazole glycerol phosphate synthase subunit HisH [Actinomycetota bacterium]